MEEWLITTWTTLDHLWHDCSNTEDLMIGLDNLIVAQGGYRATYQRMVDFSRTVDTFKRMHQLCTRMFDRYLQWTNRGFALDRSTSCVNDAKSPPIAPDGFKMRVEKDRQAQDHRAMQVWPRLATWNKFTSWEGQDSELHTYQVTVYCMPAVRYDWNSVKFHTAGKFQIPQHNRWSKNA